MPGFVHGFEEWDALLADLSDRARNVGPTEGAVHRALLDEYAKAGIPSDTGRLRLSLTSTASPDHFWRFHGDRFELGSLDPAATYNPSAVPAIDGTRAARIIGSFVLTGGTRARGGRG